MDQIGISVMEMHHFGNAIKSHYRSVFDVSISRDITVRFLTWVEQCRHGSFHLTHCSLCCYNLLRNLKDLKQGGWHWRLFQLWLLICVGNADDACYASCIGWSTEGD